MKKLLSIISMIVILSSCGITSEIKQASLGPEPSSTYYQRDYQRANRASRSSRPTPPATIAPHQTPPDSPPWPVWWSAAAIRLRHCESNNRHTVVSSNGRYFGWYQFDVQTWRSVGGKGLPHHASKSEQTYRAWLLFKSRGRAPWPYCGRMI